MIRNDKQLSLTVDQADKFKTSILELEKNKSSISTVMYNLQLKALNGQHQSLVNEIEEYNSLKDGKLFLSGNLKISELYQLLIKARIALKINQEELAKKIGTTQQQIQRYEATNYETASLARISEIIDALDVPIRIERFCCFRQTFDLPQEITVEDLHNTQRQIQKRGFLFRA